MANYTEKAILENFEAMLVELPFNKVTVSALVEKCGISPNTFYYHFRDIYALLEVWLASKERQFALDDAEIDWAALLGQLLRAMRCNAQLVYHIAGALPKERMENYIFGKIQDRFYDVARRQLKDAASEGLVQSLGELYCCTVLGYVQKFLWSHMKMDIDETVARLQRIFSSLTACMLAAIDEQK